MTATQYQEPLLDPDTKELSNDHYSLMTTAQWWKIAMWSMETGKDVKTLLLEFNPTAEEETATTIRLVGVLPNCGLAGCLDSDGSTHT
jgi:phosphoribosylaminoimidazole-succinocarboxamide synthase